MMMRKKATLRYMPISKKRLLYMEERVLYSVMVTNPSELDS